MGLLTASTKQIGCGFCEWNLRRFVWLLKYVFTTKVNEKTQMQILVKCLLSRAKKNTNILHGFKISNPQYRVTFSNCSMTFASIVAVGGERTKEPMWGSSVVCVPVTRERMGNQFISAKPNQKQILLFQTTGEFRFAHIFVVNCIARRAEQRTHEPIFSKKDFKCQYKKVMNSITL